MYCTPYPVLSWLMPRTFTLFTNNDYTPSCQGIIIMMRASLGIIIMILIPKLETGPPLHLLFELISERRQHYEARLQTEPMYWPRDTNLLAPVAIMILSHLHRQLVTT